MDYRVAANWSRDGMRELGKTSEKERLAIAVMLKVFYGSLVGKQKLNKRQAENLTTKLQEWMASRANYVFVDRYVGARHAQLGGRFDSVLLGSFIEAMGNSGSRDIEGSLRFVGFFARFGRKRSSIHFSPFPVYLRGHAIQRYIERTDLSFDEALRDTEATLLLGCALRLGVEPGAAVPFMSPARNGVFLGLQVVDEPELDKVYSFISGTKGTHEKESTIVLPPTTLWINTFVSVDDLGDEQSALRERLMDFVGAHREMLIHFALALVGESEDDFLFPGELGDRPEAMLDELRAITRSNLWKAAIKFPSHSIFEDYIKFQERVDRYGIKVLLRAHGVDLDDPESLKNALRIQGAGPAFLEEFMKRADEAQDT